MKLYEELGWETLSERRWQRRLSTFYKIVNNLTPAYLRDHIPQQVDNRIFLRKNILYAPFSRTQRFSNSFFPYCINHWNALDDFVTSAPSLATFKSSLNKFIRPKVNTFYSILDNYGIKLLTRIRVTFSD